MAAKYDLNDDGVVVIVGSGAGGGTLGNELAQKGIKVGDARGRAAHRDRRLRQRRVGQLRPALLARQAHHLGRLAGGQGFPNLPAWICKTVGGTTTHWAGASLRFQEHEFKAQTIYGDIQGANLLDWPITLAELEPYYAKAEDKMGVTRTNGIPGLPGNNNFKVLYSRRQAARLQGGPYRPHGDQQPASATTGRPASRSASASRAASPAPSGRRSTPRSRAARRPASSNCGPNARCCRSSTTTPAR